MEKIRIVGYQPQLGGSPFLEEKVLRHARFEVHANTEITGFQGDGKLSAVNAKNRASGEELVVQPAAAFVYVGLDPNTEFLRGRSTWTGGGVVVTDDALQTTMLGVFAAGDVRAGSTKQLASAIGEGVTSLIGVRRYLEKQTPKAGEDSLTVPVGQVRHAEGAS